MSTGRGNINKGEILDLGSSSAINGTITQIEGSNDREGMMLVGIGI